MRKNEKRKKRRKNATPSRTSPTGGTRGCLCEDNTYHPSCCDGTSCHRTRQQRRGPRSSAVGRGKGAMGQEGRPRVREPAPAPIPTAGGCRCPAQTDLGELRRLTAEDLALEVAEVGVLRAWAVGVCGVWGSRCVWRADGGVCVESVRWSRSVVCKWSLTSVSDMAGHPPQGGGGGRNGDQSSVASQCRRNVVG